MLDIETASPLPFPFFPSPLRFRLIPTHSFRPVTSFVSVPFYPVPRIGSVQSSVFHECLPQLIEGTIVIRWKFKDSPLSDLVPIPTVSTFPISFENKYDRSESRFERISVQADESI